MKWIILFATAMLLVFATVAAGAMFKFDAISQGETAAAGEQYETMLSISAEDNLMESGVRMAVAIPELGVWKRIGPHYPDRSEFSKKLFLELPANTQKGDYLARIVVSDDNGKRVKHRFVTVG